MGRLQLSGRTLSEAQTILADIAKQPVPARLIISMEEDAKELAQPRPNVTSAGESQTLGSIGVGLRTVDGK